MPSDYEKIYISEIYINSDLQVGIWFGSVIACFEICVETDRQTDQPTNPDTNFKMVRG